MSVTNPPPLPVSPLIKLARWGFLIWGIVHGFKQNKIFKEQAECCREQEKQRTLIRRPILQREKENRDRAEAEELKRMFLGDEQDDCLEDDDDDCYDEDDLGY